MNEKLKEAVATLKELGFEPVKDAINHRVKSPFFGGFVISWLFLNWDKILILCFSSSPIMERITTIKAIPNNSVLWGHNISNSHTLWIPLLASVLITLFSPFVSFLLESFHKGVVSETEGKRFAKQAIILQKKRYLIIAEVNNESQKETELLKVKAMQAASKAEIAASTANIESLENQSKALSEQIDAKSQTNRSLEENISRLQQKIETLTPVVANLESDNKKITDLENAIKTKDEAIRELEKQWVLSDKYERKGSSLPAFENFINRSPAEIAVLNATKASSFVQGKISEEK